MVGYVEKVPGNGMQKPAGAELDPETIEALKASGLPFEKESAMPYDPDKVLGANITAEEVEENGGVGGGSIYG